MRTKVSLVMAAAVVMCLASIADAQPGRGPGRRGFGGGFGGFGGFGKLQLLQNSSIQKELEMTDEQIEKIKKLQEELRANSPFGRGRGNFQGRGRGRGQGGQNEDGGRRRRRSRPQEDEGARYEFQPGEYFVQDENEEQPRRRGFQQLTEEERQERMEQFRKLMEERRKKEEDGLKKILLPHQLKRLNEISIQLQGIRALQNPEVAGELKVTKKQQDEMREVQEELREKNRDKMREIFQSGDRDKIREQFAEMQKKTEKEVLGCLTSSQRKQFEKMKGKPFEIDRSELFGGFRRGGFRGGQGRGPQGGGQQGGDRRRPAPDA